MCKKTTTSLLKFYAENNNIETEIEGAQTSNLNNKIFNKLDQKKLDL